MGVSDGARFAAFVGTLAATLGMQLLMFLTLRQCAVLAAAPQQCRRTASLRQPDTFCECLRGSVKRSYGGRRQPVPRQEQAVAPALLMRIGAEPAAWVGRRDPAPDAADSVLRRPRRIVGGDELLRSEPVIELVPGLRASALGEIVGGHLDAMVEVGRERL